MPPDAAGMLPADITLGILAGGRGSRLGGVEKAWLERDGIPQVIRWRDRFAAETNGVLVSANRDHDRFTAHGLRTVADRFADAGPMAGLDALANACNTPWLFTLPVDLHGVNDCLLRTLVSMRGRDGACAIDDDGLQPLVALWLTESLRRATTDAFDSGKFAIRALHATLDMTAVSFDGVRFGNLNTPEDLAAAGAVLPIR